MADAKLLTIGGLSFWDTDSGSTTFATFALDATNDTVCWVFQMPEAATITGGGFKYDLRTGTPPVYRLSLQGVSVSTGGADGTVLGGGSPASQTFTPPADGTWDGTWREITFANTYTCARGDLIALVVDYSSGTVNGSNFSTIAHGWPAAAISNSVRPYSATVNAGGSPTKFETPTFLVRSASKAYGRPVKNINKDVFSSDDTPDEKALRFVLDSGWGSTYQVVGVRAAIRTGAGSKTMKVALYDGTSELQNVTIDSDQLGSNVEHGRAVDLYFNETTLSTLSHGSTYRIGFAPQETATSFSLYTYESNAAGDLSAWPCGTNFFLSTRTDSGAWTDVPTQRPLVELILADWTEPSGGASTASRARIFGGY